MSPCSGPPHRGHLGFVPVANAHSPPATGLGLSSHYSSVTPSFLSGVCRWSRLTVVHSSASRSQHQPDLFTGTSPKESAALPRAWEEVKLRDIIICLKMLSSTPLWTGIIGWIRNTLTSFLCYVGWFIIPFFLGERVSTMVSKAFQIDFSLKGAGIFLFLFVLNSQFPM